MQKISGFIAQAAIWFRVEIDFQFVQEDTLGLMPSLQGDFALMPLSFLVRFLIERNASGTLVLEQEAVRRQVVLHQGSVMSAGSNLPREYLGQFLINLGHITEEQFHRAYLMQRETKILLGRLLVQAKLVSESALKSVLAMKYRETLLEAYSWNDGQFHFSEGTPPAPDGLDVKVSLKEIDADAGTRMKAWADIRKVFPSGEYTLLIREENLAEALRPGSLDERVFTLARTGVSIDEIGMALHATEFFLYNRLVAFYRLGAVTVGPKLSGPHALASVSAGILAEAHMATTQGEFREAWELLRQAKALGANVAVAKLVAILETAWSSVLHREWHSTPKVPSLAINDIKGRGLTSAERYLLSRVDGQRDIAAITSVAPLPQFEILASFDYFLGQRWISVKSF
jgi:hypothetical protein